MKKYGFHIQKGGVGKTTLTGNISYLLSQNKKTAMLDCDPQGSLTSWFLDESKSIKHDISDILKGDVEVFDALLEIKENLFLMPNASINGELRKYAENKLADEIYIFFDLMEELENQNFEYIIVDLSPGMSRLEKSIIMALDEVITPLTPEYFSIDGVEVFKSELEKINKNLKHTKYPKTLHSKIIINSLNRSFKLHNSILEAIKQMPYELFEISQDRKIADAQAYKQTLFEFAPNSKTVSQFQKISKSLI